MTRRTVETRLSRLEEQMRQRRAESDLQFLQAATLEEATRILELLAQPPKTTGGSNGKISPEETPELFTLFETLLKRFESAQNQK